MKFLEKIFGSQEKLKYSSEKSLEVILKVHDETEKVIEFRIIEHVYDF